MTQAEKDAAIAAAQSELTAALDAEAQALAVYTAAQARVAAARSALDAANAIVVDVARTATVYKQPINPSALVLLKDHAPTDDAYQRYRLVPVWRTDGVVVDFKGVKALATTQYRLMYRPILRDSGQFGSWVEISRATVTAGSRFGKFTLLLAGVADGVGQVQIQPLTATSESFPMMTVVINLSGGAAGFPWYIEGNGTYEWAQGTLEQRYTIKSTALDTAQARPRALDTSDWAAFGQNVTQASEAAAVLNSLYRINYQPPGFHFLPRRTIDGVTVSAGTQPYFMPGITDFQPYMPLVDGEYGQAMGSHNIWGILGRHHKAYHNTGVSLRVTDTTGRTRTILGWRHAYAPEHADVTAHTAQGKLHPAVETIGQWPTEIPPFERKPRMAWNWFFVKSTVGIGTGTQTVKDSTMHFAEVPHDAPVVSYVTNGHGGRILRLIHNARDHTVPVIVEIAARTGGLNVPTFGAQAAWNYTDEVSIVDLEDGTYAVAERYPNRISRWRMKGIGQADEFVEYIIDGVQRPGHQVQDGAIKTTWTEAALRALPVACPEGLAYQDGWLYYGSSLAGQWRRINVATKQMQLVCPERSTRETQVTFYQGSLSDGTAFPRGTLVHCDFDNQSSGPRFHLPRAGKDRRGDSYTHCDEYVYNSYGAWADRATFAFPPRGHAQAVGIGPTVNGIYPLFAFAGNGGILWGGTESWLSALRAPKTGEVMPNQSQLATGRNKYLAAGYEVIWGPYGDGASSLPYPEDVDIRYWLRHGCGINV